MRAATGFRAAVVGRGGGEGREGDGGKRGWEQSTGGLAAVEDGGETQ